VHKRNSGSANQTAELEVNPTYTEEVFLCHTGTGLVLEPPRTRKKRKTEKDLEKKARGRS
jgi:hypothetical protein